MVNHKYFLQYFDHKSSMQLSALKPFLNYGRFFIQKQRRMIPQIMMPSLKTLAVRDFSEQQNPHQYDDFSLHDREFLQLIELNEEKAQVSEDMKKQMNKQCSLNNIQQITYEANAPTEDRLVIGELKQINGYIISIFDGHGGYMLSDYASHKITDLIEQFLSRNLEKTQYVQKKQQLVSDALKWAYEMIEQNFYEDIYVQQIALQNKKVKNVGACGLTVIISEDQIYVANCGDSQAIAVTNQFENLEYVKLNQRLSVTNPHERERLVKEFPDDPDILIEGSKGAYYLKGRLQPTRTLGDYHLKKKQLWRGKGEFHGPYVSHIPDIQIFPRKKQYKSIVVASDGIWDYIDTWAVSRITLEQNASLRIFEETMKKIANLHKKTVEEILCLQPGQRRKFHDDISLVVVDISQKIGDN